jgi:hypothetical protein
VGLWTYLLLSVDLFSNARLILRTISPFSVLVFTLELPSCQEINEAQWPDGRVSFSFPLFLLCQLLKTFYCGKCNTYSKSRQNFMTFLHPSFMVNNYLISSKIPAMYLLTFEINLRLHYHFIYKYFSMINF